MSGGPRVGQDTIFCLYVPDHTDKEINFYPRSGRLRHLKNLNTDSMVKNLKRIKK